MRSHSAAIDGGARSLSSSIGERRRQRCCIARGEPRARSRARGAASQAEEPVRGPGERLGRGSGFGMSAGSCSIRTGSNAALTAIERFDGCRPDGGDLCAVMARQVAG